MSLLLGQTAPPTEDIASFVTARFDHAKAASLFVQQRLPRLYTTWRGIASGSWDDFRNNVWIPLTHGTVMADVAQTVEMVLSQFPLISVQGYAPEDAPGARKQAMLLDAQLRDMDIWHVFSQLRLQADICGVGILQTGWKVEQGVRMLALPQQMPDGRTVIQHVPQPMTQYDGPDAEVVDRADFFQQPGVRDLKDMQWIIRRHLVPIETVAAWDRQGMLRDGALDQLRQSGGAPSADILTRPPSWMDGWTGQTAQARFTEPHATAVEVLEYWCRDMPADFRVDDPRRRILIANRTIVLADDPNPYWHGAFPFFLHRPRLDPYYFDAPGIVEIMEKSQGVINRLWNQRLDAGDQIISPMWKADQSALISRNLTAAPGRIVWTNGPPSSAIEPLSPDMRGIALSGELLQELYHGVQIGTGKFEDSSLGGTPDVARETAHGVMARTTAAGTRSAHEARLMETQVFEPLCRQMQQMNKQLLPTPREVLILGSAAHVDPATGLPIPPSRETVRAEDLMADYPLRCYGTQSTVNKQTMQTTVATITQQVLSSPIAAQAVPNMPAFLKWAFTTMGATDVDTWMAAPPPPPGMNGMMPDGPPPGMNGTGAQPGMAPTGATPPNRLEGMM